MVKDDTHELLAQESNLRWEAHRREHDVQERVVIHEAASIKDSLGKADAALEKRLETMNEFRAQLGSQAATFLTNVTFDTYAKETRDRLEVALNTANEKTDALVRSVVNRHESDYNTIRELLEDERGKREKAERESGEWQKKFEGSVNTFKYIVGFIGLPGIGAILFLLSQTHLGG